jgi:hypothetical protein
LLFSYRRKSTEDKINADAESHPSLILLLSLQNHKAKPSAVFLLIFSKILYKNLKKRGLSKHVASVGAQRGTIVLT